MALPNIFSKEVSNTVISRINLLTPETQPKWGKMNSGQMLAHCNVTYEMVYEPDRHPKPGLLMKIVLKSFIKGVVTGEAAYKHNSRTAPAFLISDNRNFEAERTKLINNINKTQQNGEQFFDNKESNSFGPLNKTEWNNLFYKHLDHHLSQFGV